MIKLLQAIIGASTIAYIGAQLTNELIPMLNQSMNFISNMPLG